MAEQQPTFYYDLGSPYAYLAAERVNHVLGVVPIWQPISLSGLWALSGGISWASTGAREENMREIERRAEVYGLQEIRWPDPWPSPTLQANEAAIYAQSGGRAVAFSLAAFRQAFAAGRDLSDLDNILIAAAACELHPKAVTKALESRSVKERTQAATQEAFEVGVRGVPTVRVGDQLFWGDDQLEAAAAALRGVTSDR